MGERSLNDCLRALRHVGWENALTTVVPEGSQAPRPWRPLTDMPAWVLIASGEGRGLERAGEHDGEQSGEHLPGSASGDDTAQPQEAGVTPRTLGSRPSASHQPSHQRLKATLGHYLPTQGLTARKSATVGHS